MIAKGLKDMINYQASQDSSIVMANLNIINTEKKVPLNVGIEKKSRNQ